MPKVGFLEIVVATLALVGFGGSCLLFLLQAIRGATEAVYCSH